MQYRQMLQQTYPHIQVVGRNFPPTPQKVLIAQVGQYAFFAGIALVFMGDQIFAAIGRAPPGWYHSMAENKMQSCLMLWIMNSIAASQMSTGAFEISFNGETIFSKIETNRLPSIDELITVLNMRVPGAVAGDNANWH